MALSGLKEPEVGVTILDQPDKIHARGLDASRLTGRCTDRFAARNVVEGNGCPREGRPVDLVKVSGTRRSLVDFKPLPDRDGCR